MKKLFSMMLVSFLLFASTSFAQRATTMPTVAGDTIVNTATVSKTITLSAGYEGIVISPAYKKVSGTNAGNIVLYQSLNGVDFRSTGDTLKPATDTVAFWSKTSPVPVFYKISGTGSGTMSGRLRIEYVLRKHD